MSNEDLADLHQMGRRALNREITFTNDTKYVASRAGAYWVIDEIALAQRYEEIEPFRAWRVTVKGRRFPAKTAPATQYARSPLSSPTSQSPASRSTGTPLSFFRVNVDGLPGSKRRAISK